MNYIELSYCSRSLGGHTIYIDNLNQLFSDMWPHLNERAHRLFAAAEAKRLGHGGITTISTICGLSRVTITKGIKELENEPLEKGRIRQPGSGRPTLLSIYPEIKDVLTQILEETTRCEPESFVVR
jgi:hypothetical protein